MWHCGPLQARIEPSPPLPAQIILRSAGCGLLTLGLGRTSTTDSNCDFMVMAWENTSWPKSGIGSSSSTHSSGDAEKPAVLCPTSLVMDEEGKLVVASARPSSARSFARPALCPTMDDDIDGYRELIIILADVFLSTRRAPTTHAGCNHCRHFHFLDYMVSNLQHNGIYDVSYCKRGPLFLCYTKRPPTITPPPLSPPSSPGSRCRRSWSRERGAREREIERERLRAGGLLDSGAMPAPTRPGIWADRGPGSGPMVHGQEFPPG